VPGARVALSERVALPALLVLEVPREQPVLLVLLAPKVVEPMRTPPGLLLLGMILSLCSCSLS